MEELNLGSFFRYDLNKKEWIRKEHQELYMTFFDGNMHYQVQTRPFNSFNKIPLEIASFLHLKVVYLDNKQISQIENLEKLTALQSLYLWSNQITVFEKSLFLFPRLRELGVGGHHFRSIPREITEQHNCLVDAKRWFADLEEGSVKNYKIKLIVCGNGRVGKSTL